MAEAPAISGQRGTRVLCPIHQPNQPAQQAAAAAAAAPEATAVGPNGPMQGCQGNEVFNTAFATGLAGCAFGAYHQAQGDLKFYEADVSGNQTAYLSRDFFAREVGGALHVTIVSADNLTDHGVFGKGTINASVSLGVSTFRTKPVLSKPSVAWNQSSYLYLRKPFPETSELMLELFSLNEVKQRVPIGFASITLDAALCDGAPHERRLLLRGEGGPEVALQLQWHDAADVAASALLDPNIETSEGLAPPVFGFALPSPDGKLDWRALLAESGALVASQYDPIAYLDNTRTDTQVWVLRQKAERSLVVAFRGADAKRVKGLLTDVALTPVVGAFGSTVSQVDGIVKGVQGGDANFNLMESVLKDARSTATTAAQSAGRAAKQVATWIEGKFMGGHPAPEVMNPVLPPLPPEQPWVHGGFYRSYDSVRARLLEIVGTVMAGTGEEPWHVFVTGHSVGGALASLFAYELAVSRYEGLPAPKVSSYTYGSPRVGNAPWAAAYNLAVPDTWRVTSSRDAVPTVPKLMGYCHVDHHVMLDGKAPYSIVATVGAAFEGTYAKKLLTQWKDRMFSRSTPAAAPADAAVPSEAAAQDTASTSPASEAASGGGGNGGGHGGNGGEHAAQPQPPVAEQTPAATADVQSSPAAAAEGALAAAEEGNADDILDVDRLQLEELEGSGGEAAHGESHYLQNLTFLVSGAATRVANDTA